MYLCHSAGLYKGFKRLPNIIAHLTTKSSVKRSYEYMRVFAVLWSIVGWYIRLTTIYNKVQIQYSQTVDKLIVILRHGHKPIQQDTILPNTSYYISANCHFHLTQIFKAACFRSRKKYPPPYIETRKKYPPPYIELRK